MPLPTLYGKTISIHALREEGDQKHGKRDPAGAISIHALREEGDLDLFAVDGDGVLFLSTPSARRATQQTPEDLHRVHISIHALREEGDRTPAPSSGRHPYFYPRPPRGGRPQGGASTPGGAQDFYPRPPRGGRHTAFPASSIITEISIHALREEGDNKGIAKKRLSR